MCEADVMNLSCCYKNTKNITLCGIQPFPGKILRSIPFDKAHFAVDADVKDSLFGVNICLELTDWRYFVFGVAIVIRLTPLCVVISPLSCSKAAKLVS
jgi:hypothetical protein